jgi:hypothetical protein
MLALIEAAGHIRTHPFLESTQSEFLFEQVLQLGLAPGVAAPARMSGFALIAADEQMLLELGHNPNLQDFRGRRERGAGSAWRLSALGSRAFPDAAHEHFQESDNQEESTQCETNHSCEQEDETPDT